MLMRCALSLNNSLSKFFLLSTTGLVFCLSLGLTACSGQHDKPNVELIQNMMEMPYIKAQRLDPQWAARTGGKMREPVKGTIPRGYEPYRYAANDTDAAQAAKMPNPLPMTMDTLQRGQLMYNTYCIVCHGVRAEGDGLVVEHGFQRPPSLHSDKVRGWTDGRIFHTITVGQNMMPSYATQITRQDRWAIIRYVRALQRANNPTPNDLKEFSGGGK